MDHDAMLIDVRKLKQFRDDFLTVSKMTPERLHEMAERVRAGKPAELDNGPDDDGSDGDQLKDLGDSKQAVEIDPESGKPKVSTDDMLSGDGTGSDQGDPPADQGDKDIAAKDADTDAQSDPDADGADGAADANAPTDGATKPA
jgi:hypothetical protein